MREVLIDTKLYRALIRYRTIYINKQLEKLDESSTRILINHLLSDVLGYRELVEIKTEYRVKGGMIDYLIELDNKKLFVVEVKSFGTNLTQKHLRQAIYYGTTVGSDYIILTNGRNLDLYRIAYYKPIRVNKLFSIDLKRLDANSRYFASLITKSSIKRGELDRLAQAYDRAFGLINI